MPTFTFITDYRGGAYITQKAAPDLQEALMRWQHEIASGGYVAHLDTAVFCVNSKKAQRNFHLSLLIRSQMCGYSTCLWGDTQWMYTSFKPKFLLPVHNKRTQPRYRPAVYDAGVFYTVFDD